MLPGVFSGIALAIVSIIAIVKLMLWVLCGRHPRNYRYSYCRYPIITANVPATAPPSLALPLPPHVPHPPLHPKPGRNTLDWTSDGNLRSNESLNSKCLHSLNP